MVVEIWSDIVCPWCYIGKRRFEQALASFARRDMVEVVHRSFQLDPTSARGQTINRRQMLQAKYGWSTIQAQETDARMIALAAADGLAFTMDASGVTGNTLDAHQLVHLAKARGMQGQVIERLFRAYFTEQRSIFDRDSLVALAAEAGLDAEAARDVLTHDTYADAVARDNANARALGANGVPFFVFDQRYGVSGAQAVEVFTGALARAGEDSTA